MVLETEKLQEEVIKDKKQEVVEELEEDSKVVKHHYIEDYQKRGFTNIHANTYTEVTFKMLNKVKNTDVTAESLLEEGIIGKINDGIVILATGKLEKKIKH